VLRDAEIDAVVELISAGSTLSQGPWRDRFDQEFAELIGTRHAFSVTSGTVSLAFAVHLLDLRPGDEVIVTPQTYKATIQPLLDYQVNVRFCDIDDESMNISPAAFADLITPRTRALLLVHYGGLPADMDAIMAIARRHDIVVVEDCAHALGSVHHGRRPGALADIGCFSFHSSKNITTLGEGGMLTFSRDDWADRIARIRSNDADGVYTPASGLMDTTAARWAVHSAEAYSRLCTEVRYAGSNATLNEAGAAVGLVQLSRLPELTERRRSIAARLDALLSRFPGVRVPRVPPDVQHAYHLYTFFVTPELGVGRDELLTRLEERGVQIQLRYLPLYLLPEWRHRGHGPGECPVAERLWFEQQVNLPCYPALTDEQVEHMLAAVDAVLTEAHEGRTAGAASGGMRTWV
jgi:dTDP-4-amino-4,6-dideoxygalactose transaminase